MMVYLENSAGYFFGVRGGGGLNSPSYPVPVVDVHLFPVRPQRVHHLGVPRSYRQNQGRVSILSISKRGLMRRFIIQQMQHKGHNSDFLPCWGRWCRRRKTGGSPWPLRGGSVWPASAGNCRPVTHKESVQSVYACIIIISLLPVYIYNYHSVLPVYAYITIISVLPVYA